MDSYEIRGIENARQASQWSLDKQLALADPLQDRKKVRRLKKHIKKLDALLKGAMMETEFKTGDLVTFAPYEIEIPAKVLNVRPQLKNDDRVFYDLIGIDPKKPCKPTCTGQSSSRSNLVSN